MEYSINKVLKHGSAFTPRVMLVEYQDKPVVLKDYSKCLNLTQVIWGKTLVNNEYAILKRLQGVRGIPQLLGRTRSGVLTEYIEGEPLGRLKGQLPYEVIPRIEALIARMHKHGVVHLDLAQKRNIILTPGMEPYLIDFANALYFRRSSFGFKQLFEYLCMVDRGSLLKFKNRYFPGQMTDEDKRFMKKFWWMRRLWIFNPKTFRPSDRI